MNEIIETPFVERGPRRDANKWKKGKKGDAGWAGKARKAFKVRERELQEDGLDEDVREF